MSAGVEAQEYLYITYNLRWGAADLICECFGTLARFDTEAEFNHFRTQM